MDRTICVSIVIVFLKVAFTSAGDYPSFMDEDDIRTMGLGRNPYNPNPHHRAPHVEPTATGRYTGHPMGYKLDPYGSFEHPDNLPANAMAPHRVPINQNIQRGDPLNQDIIQMVEDAQIEKPFPEDDGNPPNTNDARELDELTDRLSKAKKWGEFRTLLAEEQAQFAPGQVMQNWEEDAHKWASYSKHLLVRAAHAQNVAARQGATPQPMGKPNVGMSPYWSEDKIPKKVPSDKVSKTWWMNMNMRRQMFTPYEEGTFDNIQGPLDHALPPMFTKAGDQQDDYAEYGGTVPRPGVGKGIGRSRDSDYFTPGHGADHLAELDYGTFRNGDLEKFMPGYPGGSGPGPDGPSNDPDDVIRTKPRRNPGPGSERDYPDGFKPNMGGSGSNRFPNFMDPGQDPAFTGGNYPQSKKMFGKPGARMGNIPQLRAAPPPGAGKVHAALRMGMEMGKGKLPGAGSEKDFPGGYRPGSMMPGKSLAPGGYGGYGGYRGGGGGGGGGPARGPRPMPGINREFPPGFGEKESSAPDYGQLPRNLPKQFHQNLEDPDLRHPPPRLGGQNGKNSKSPPGFMPASILLSIANKKLADLDHIDEIKNLEMEKQRTSTLRPLTREDMLKSLQQFDDFKAPIRWVKFNSPDTRDGLARVTDKETKQNQQFIIEGELYVPVIDESMLRLGWTTESSHEISTTQAAIHSDEAAIRVVMRSMNISLADQKDWLVYETIVGAKVQREKECDGENCQSRCSRMGCDTVCRGDTCASGCVGSNCKSLCTGPGCNSMCIGDHCTAKCEGISCEARCYGEECETDCKSFSCMKTKNGQFRGSNSTWNHMYPQYGMDYGQENHMRQGPAQYDERQNDYY